MTHRRVVVAMLAAMACGTAAAPQPIFDGLLTDLRSPREGTRLKAVRTLTTSGYPGVAAALTPLLTDPSNAVQLATIDALVTVALAPAPSKRHAAPFQARNGSIAGAVLEAGPLAVLPRERLGETLTALVAATKDDEPRVRTGAAWALAVLAGPAMGGIPATIEQPLVNDVVYALQHPDQATREALVVMAGVVFEPAAGASVPVAIGDALIAAMNDGDPAVRVAASDALGWMRERRAVQALSERLAFYKTGREAEAALHALARIPDPSSAAAFRQYAASGPTPARVVAIEGLGRLGEPSAVPTITDAVGRDRSASVALAGAFAYYLLGEPSNLDRLVTALARRDTARQARAYLTELGASVAPRLHAWLSHGEPAVRQAVVEVLGLSGHAASIEVLQPLARDADPAVAEVTRHALARLRGLPSGARTR